MATLSAAPDPTIGTMAAQLDGVTKRYRGGVTALADLSLRLPRGEVLALLGPNGAGKSTAVRLMMGLAAPSQGSVRIFGRDPRHSGSRLRTGVMLQVGKAPETLRVREHLDLFRGYYPHPLPRLELVRLAGLEGLEDRLFGQLSGGQKQRVLFALALAGDPDLLFLDEPTVGLDIEARRGMWAQIRALHARGKTILLTTHYLEEADALASRIAVINNGRLITEGTPAQIKAHGAAGSPPAFAPRSGVPQQVLSPSQKTIHCHTGLNRDRLLLLPGIVSVAQPPRELDDTRPLPTTIASAAPELTLRDLLAMDPSLSGLTVTPPALEDAFLALTQPAPSTPTHP